MQSKLWKKYPDELPDYDKPFFGKYQDGDWWIFRRTFDSDGWILERLNSYGHFHVAKPDFNDYESDDNYEIVEWQYVDDLITPQTVNETNWQEKYEKLKEFVRGKWKGDCSECAAIANEVFNKENHEAK